MANLDLNSQIHGDFNEDLLRLKRDRPASYSSLSGQKGALKVSQQADYLLFDAPLAGSGQTFDWQAF